MPEFQLFFQKKLVIFRLYNHKLLLVMLPIVTPYSCEQIIYLLPTVVLHYTVLSCLPEFLIEAETLSVACSFSYDEDSINDYSFIARVIELLKLYMSMCMDIHWHIHIDTTPNKLFF